YRQLGKIQGKIFIEQERTIAALFERSDGDGGRLFERPVHLVFERLRHHAVQDDAEEEQDQRQRAPVPECQTNAKRHGDAGPGRGRVSGAGCTSTWTGTFSFQDVAAAPHGLNELSLATAID